MTVEILGLIWLLISSTIGHIVILWAAYCWIARTLENAKIGERVRSDLFMSSKEIERITKNS